MKEEERSNSFEKMHFPRPRVCPFLQCANFTLYSAAAAAKLCSMPKCTSPPNTTKVESEFSGLSKVKLSVLDDDDFQSEISACANLTHYFTQSTSFGSGRESNYFDISSSSSRIPFQILTCSFGFEISWQNALTISSKDISCLCLSLRGIFL